jgi:hypothetical protein
MPTIAISGEARRLLRSAPAAVATGVRSATVIGASMIPSFHITEEFYGLLRQFEDATPATPSRAQISSKATAFRLM